MSTHTPPPPPSAPRPPEPRRSSATKPIMIIIGVIGALVLVFLLLTTLFNSVVGLNRGKTIQTADVTGVSHLEVHSNGAHVSVLFDDVDEVSLEAIGQHGNGWDLTRRGNTLAVEAPRTWWSWCWFNCEDTNVTVVLPEGLNDGNLNADLELNAGTLDATGDFNELTVELNAGEANVNGTATRLQAEVNAGSVNVELADVATAVFEVSAGRIDADLTGTAPTSTDIEVNAGRLALTLPDDEYAVISETAAGGSVSNNLRLNPAATNHISMELAAGEVTLNPGQ